MSDIKTALDAIKGHTDIRQTYIDYYDGRHPLAFATEKFKTAFGQTLKNMRDNLCPIVVDAVADRMEVINFAGDDEKKTVDTTSWKLWQREKMELVSNETHVEAAKTGCAYVIVWGDEQNKAKFYLQDSRQCVIIEDEDTGTPLYGAKQWVTVDKFVRLTLYYPDRTEKYISDKKRTSNSTPMKAENFIPVSGDEQAVTENTFNTIPMFEFECLPVLRDAMPIQDALNKTIADKLVAMEFAAYPQRYATGLEPPANEITGKKELPFKAGVDRLWFTGDKDAKFGQFHAADLKAFLEVADAYRLEMARVSGTPLHFFSINTSDAISGEALKTLESRFTKKVKRLCINFGSVWAAAMKLAMQIEQKSPPENLTAQWESPEQRSEKEVWEVLGLKDKLGVPKETLWEEAGYTSEDIVKFKAAMSARVPPILPPATVEVPKSL